jgi:hypothetical protein
MGMRGSYRAPLKRNGENLLHGKWTARSLDQRRQSPLASSRQPLKGLNSPPSSVAKAPDVEPSFRTVTPVDAPPTKSPDGCQDLFNRRQLFGLAGSVGLAATAIACSNPPPATGPSTTSTLAVGPQATPPPASLIPPSPPPSAATADLLCRDAWGARPPKPGGRPHTITRMTLHHTGAVLGDNRNAPSRLRQHQRLHQDENGWIDIAYHVSVDRNGNIYDLRTTDLAGDTATNYDPIGHFLVLCEGDFDQELVTEAQLNGAALVFAWATKRFHVAADTLGAHKDFAATACPGTNLYSHVSSGDLKRRIDDLLAAGSVDIRNACGPDAAATVADIEAGRR